MEGPLSLLQATCLDLRPQKVEARVCDAPPDQRFLPVLPEVRGKFAFVITLWGASKTYVLGAIVLGHSIRRTRTRHSLVCLHADDVPEEFLALLRRVWDCRQVEHVQAASTLSWEDQDARFEKVFTKLRAMSLVDFEKVLVMDIDMLVVRNIDDLFDLPAPAAMKRGMNDTSWKPLRHGDNLDGTRFFSGANPGKPYSWGQGTGINAGVMLWRPDLQVLDLMLEELSEPYHPEHVRGNGPEQDYLSRYWADAPWTQIAVEYNFQLHHMFNALNPWIVKNAERRRFIEDPGLIRIIHYSGDNSAKPWHRVLDPAFKEYWPDRSHDDDYAKLFGAEFYAYRLWVAKDKATWDTVMRRGKSDDLGAFSLGDDGLIYQELEDRSEEAWTAAPKLVAVDLPESATSGAVRTLSFALNSWFNELDAVQRDLKLDVVAALFAAAPAPAAPAAPAAPPARGAVSSASFNYAENWRRQKDAKSEPNDWHWKGNSGGSSSSTAIGASSRFAERSWKTSAPEERALLDDTSGVCTSVPVVLCRCGHDLAACVACGQGWAQQESKKLHQTPPAQPARGPLRATPNDAGGQCKQWAQQESKKVGQTPFAQIPLGPARGLGRSISSGQGSSSKRRKDHSPHLQWQRFGGWFHEQAPSESTEESMEGKASVVCGSTNRGQYVVFSWPGGCDSFLPGEDEEVHGVYAKILGQASRSLTLDEAALHYWASGVSEGCLVMLAIVGLEPQEVQQVLSALQCLGVPPGPVRSKCTALATAGVVRGTSPWEAHASSDAAYASALALPQL